MSQFDTYEVSMTSCTFVCSVNSWDKIWIF